MTQRNATHDVSLQARLAWRLGLVLLASLSLVIVAFAVLWVAFDEDDLDDLTLSDQAQQVARAFLRENGALRLQLPEGVAAQYEEAGDQLLYVVVKRDRRVLFSSSKRARDLAALVRVELPEKRAIIFRLPDDLNGGSSYDALVAHVPAEPDVTLIVAQRDLHVDDETFVEEFGETFIWVLPPIFILAVGISIVTIRGTLAPLKVLSDQSADIGPGTINTRLSTTGVAREIRPLVDSFNGALERLDKGYQAQRKFAANAHELRTPLAVLMARLNELDESDTKNGLEDDARRLERLVSQLLTVARAESQTLDLSQMVNLRELAADVVAFMAPLVIKHNRIRAHGGITSVSDAPNGGADFTIRLPLA